jgi:glucose-1-phosphate thymidylyltransferase
VGLIPAAGRATRLGRLPCSKEVLPVGFRSAAPAGRWQPKPVGQHLLEKMAAAGARNVFIVLRRGKWDIPDTFGDGAEAGVNLAYVVTERTQSAPETLDRAFPFIAERLVVFGFPDILFKPDDAFPQLVARQRATRADVVLGLFRAHDPSQMDMIRLDHRGRVRAMHLKPARTTLQLCWLFAVWTPAFTRFLHEFMAHRRGKATSRELSVGAVIQAALNDGMHIEGVPFGRHRYLDIGTPEALARAVALGERAVV